MNLKKILSVILFSTLTFSSLIVCADELTINDITVEEKITVNGRVNFESIGIDDGINEVNEPFYPLSISLTVYDSDNKAVYRDQKQLTVEEFEFEFDVAITEDCNLKAVVATAYGSKAEKTFAYTNKILDKLNSSFKNLNDNEAADFIVNNSRKLGLNTEAFNSLNNKKVITDIIKNTVPYESIKELSQDFCQSVCVVMLKENESSAEIKKYLIDEQDNLGDVGIIWNAIIDGKDDAEVDTMITNLISTDASYTYETFQIALENILTTNFVAKTEYYLDYAEIFTNAYNLYALSSAQLSGYNALSDKKKNIVLEQLWNNKATLTSLSTLAEAVDDAIDVAKKTSDAAGGSNSSGGGGGGGFGGVGFAEPKPTETTPQNPVNPPISTGVFNDVPDNSWYKTPVEALYKKGIINGKGNGKYDPESQVTREEFAQMLYKLTGMKMKENKKFDDVSVDAWYYEAINALASNGVVNGIGTGFGVGQAITRQDMAVMLNNTLLYLNADLNTDGVVKSPTDIDKINGYAKESVVVLMTNGILNGYEDGSYCPNGYLTRAEAAQAIYSIIGYVEV